MITKCTLAKSIHTDEKEVKIFQDIFATLRTIHVPVLNQMSLKGKIRLKMIPISINAKQILDVKHEIGEDFLLIEKYLKKEMPNIFAIAPGKY